MMNTAQVLSFLGFIPRIDFDATVREVGGPVEIVWKSASPQPTPAEITAATPAAQAAYDAAIADQQTWQTERADMQVQLQTAINRLTTIKDATSMTNAQVFNAVKDIALIQLRVLKYIRKL